MKVKDAISFFESLPKDTEISRCDKGETEHKKITMKEWIDYLKSCPEDEEFEDIQVSRQH